MRTAKEMSPKNVPILCASCVNACGTHMFLHMTPLCTLTGGPSRAPRGNLPEIDETRCGYEIFRFSPCQAWFPPQHDDWWWRGSGADVEYKKLNHIECWFRRLLLFIVTGFWWFIFTWNKKKLRKKDINLIKTQLRMGKIKFKLHF